MQSLEIQLKRPDRTYFSGEKVRGVVKINAKPGGFKSSAINLQVEGIVTFQYNGTSNLNIFDVVMNSFKPIKLLDLQIQLDKVGQKFPSGITDIPFEFVLQPLNKKIPLYETYAGVYLACRYKISCEVKMGLFSKDQKTTLDFTVYNRGQGVAIARNLISTASSENSPSSESQQDETSSPGTNIVIPKQPKHFTLTPQTLQNVLRHNVSGIPEYEIKGYIADTICDITEPFEGEIEIIKTSSRIKSVEIQLIRVESCSVEGGNMIKEATEIQNLQLGEGNVCKGLKLPIYMVFPRLFTCPTLIGSNFRIQFEVNLIVIFADGYQIIENFPIILYRKHDDNNKYTI
ncbi:hypothetical protein FDP41_012304 [Naegleria fowleri]|uniref:Arrestin C-terminal-like domain-containing protein n=1 Tax=Naegleria fowleri TaxID=5763 RepID=A0A6A5BWK8_NAEFO|nr:uncharacterized protein FDP41_012304 [Naegleria fowleri]KAF0981647.1 hypothetical protein FDP41_012304 [Naegleria fowleri]CAG4716195.1 unnamed protein product [Naegleria fowleri]